MKTKKCAQNKDLYKERKLKRIEAMVTEPDNAVKKTHNTWPDFFSLDEPLQRKS